MESSEKKFWEREIAGEPSSTDEALIIETEMPKKEIHIDKKTLVLLVGLPASGKSTFAETYFPLDAIVSTDAIRGELTNNPGNQLVSNRAFIMAKRILEERLKRGEIAVLDAQNLTEDNRQQFYDIARQCGVDVEAIFFNVPMQEIMERDRKREKHVGEAYLRQQKNAYRVALASLRISSSIRAVHVIEPDDRVSVLLPETYRESLEADQELRTAAGTAEQEIVAAETDPQHENKNARHMIPIGAGSVLFAENATDFLHEFLLPDQIIDAKRIAARLATTVEDEAVQDVLHFILRERVRLNLTTAISYPKNFPFAENLRATIREYEAKIGVAIPTPTIRIHPGKPSADTEERLPMENPEDASFAITLSGEELSRFGIEVIRSAPDDTPLFFIGDTHGCRKAVGELAHRIRQENLAKQENDECSPARKMIFVGDMGDRGPYDAQTVLYITALVRSGRAMLIRGNHDENLLNALKGKEVKSGDTRRTAEELKKRLQQRSIEKIIQVIEQAPYIAEWKTVVAAHAALPRIPRRGETLTEEEKKLLTHGAKTGRFTGRAEVHKIHGTTAKDPGILAVSGHTHETAPVLDPLSETANVDVSAQVMGRLYGLYYPERQFAYAEEPDVLKQYRILEGTTLPTGEALLDFMDYAERQGYVQTKKGQGSYLGLTLASYSEVTELTNAWETYPVLRHFRGLIVDVNGNVIARPFEKTHKAGEEIPLEKLEHIIPDKVFEKANGSLGIAYHWNGQWCFATKFSFENEAYTKRATDMFSRMQQDVLDPTLTYLFEIILPEDPHIVDYGGREDLILLNAIESKTGRMAEWDTVHHTAQALGATTARDMTGEFPGMSIADIYRYAQQEGKLKNLEGMMALYRDPASGKPTLVKIKVKEYMDKKFVRDHVDWKYIFRAIDPKTMGVLPHERERLLRYNTDNTFARAALDARLQWIASAYTNIVGKMEATLGDLPLAVEKMYADALTAGKDAKTAERAAMGFAYGQLQGKYPPVSKNDQNVALGAMRARLQKREFMDENLGRYALEQIQLRIDEETKKRGRNSFWVIPD